MNKNQITEALRHASDGRDFITRAQVQKALQCGNSTVYQFLRGIDAVQVNRKKLYLIHDVASRILAFRKG